MERCLLECDHYYDRAEGVAISTLKNAKQVLGINKVRIKLNLILGYLQSFFQLLSPSQHYRT